MRRQLMELFQERGLWKLDRLPTAEEVLAIVNRRLQSDRLIHLAPPDPRLDDDIPF